MAVHILNRFQICLYGVNIFPIAKVVQKPINKLVIIYQQKNHGYINNTTNYKHDYIRSKWLHLFKGTWLLQASPLPPKVPATEISNPRSCHLKKALSRVSFDPKLPLVLHLSSTDGEWRPRRSTVQGGGGG